jgi:hypothetical protein
LNKAEKSGIDIDVIFEVFARGYEQNEDINEAFNRVNSFIAGGKAAGIDNDLSEKVKAPTGGLKDACWSGYTAVGMKMKNGRKVPNCVPEETEVVESSQDLAKRYKDYVTGGGTPQTASRYKSHVNMLSRKTGKKPSDINKEVRKHVASMKEETVSEGGVRGMGRGNVKGRDYDPEKLYKQNPAYVGAKAYRKPWEKSKADMTKDINTAFQQMADKGKDVKVLPPGKKTPKAMVRPRDWMKPNQASRVTESIVNEVNRRADVRIVKVRMDDGTVKYRKERVRAAVQNEATHTHPTGKTPYVDLTAKELRADLSKKVKAASESYTGSEPTSSNKNDPSNRFVGTDAIRKNYAAATPGQTTEQIKQDLSKKHLNDIRKALGGIRESRDLNESFAAGFELAPLAHQYGINVQSSFVHDPSVQEQLDAMEATYQGKTVPLNKPMKGDVKKSKVYVDPDGDGKAKKVNFGDKKLSIKKDQPARKRSYCARSGGQGNLSNKSSANYWSRRAWDC